VMYETCDKCGPNVIALFEATYILSGLQLTLCGHCQGVYGHGLAGNGWHSKSMAVYATSEEDSRVGA